MSGLDEHDADPDPFVQFGRWFEEARATETVEPTAMTLATATADGRPSARMVLLKGFDQRGFVFHTNYASRKAGELAADPWAALVLYWGVLSRQVRVEGTVHRLPRAESEAYWRTRPPGSRLGALASRQSEVIPSRDVLTKRYEELAAAYADREIPLPPFWGGYRLVPHTIELWQGRPDRLHDRLRYTRLSPDAGWHIERLAP